MSTAKVAVYDSRPLEEAGAESIARALAKAWDEENFSDSSSDRRGDLAALWSIGQATIAKLGGTLIKIPIGVGGFFGYVAPGSGNVADQSYPSEIERSIAVAIANVFGWTAAQVEPTGTPAGTVTIGESGPGDLQYSDAAAAAPPAAVLMFAAAFLVASGALLVHEIGGAAAQWTFARNVPTIVDRLLARQEETRVQFLGLAQLVKLTSEHAASEKEAGKRLSWSEGELAGIRAAQDRKSVV